VGFRDVYPKQLDKPRAYRCWQARLQEGVAARDLVAAAANYAAYCCKHGTLERYIKYPANFLGQDMSFQDWVNRGEDGEGEAAREAREKKKEFIRSLYLV
jgi:hypothetical protein